MPISNENGVVVHIIPNRDFRCNLRDGVYLELTGTIVETLESKGLRPENQRKFNLKIKRRLQIKPRNQRKKQRIKGVRVASNEK